MPLTLYYHPLSSYCQKVLIALYEAGTPFVAHMIDLGNESDRALLQSHWSLCKFPVLQDTQRGHSLPESSTIIEYLDQYSRAAPMIPVEFERAIEVRLWDRIFDNYVQTPLQQIVGDRLRQSNADLSGARAMLASTYGLIDRQLENRSWVADAAFSLADCAAAPALFYASALLPLPEKHGFLQQYFERLVTRPSVRRVIAEARPYFHLFPFNDAIAQRFLE